MLHHSLVTLIVTETVTRDECNVTMISLLIKITLHNNSKNHLVIKIFLEMILFHVTMTVTMIMTVTLITAKFSSRLAGSN